MKTHKIYGHKSPSNKWYIGRTSKNELKYRWQNGTGYKGSPKIWNAFIKYGDGDIIKGFNKFEHVFIAECETEDQAIIVEAIFKRIYDSVDNGYNCSKEFEGNSPMLGRSHTEESKLKMSKSRLGKPGTMLGKKLSDETKKKLSDAKLGNVPWNKGKTHCYSEETLERMSKNSIGKNKGNKRKPFTEEHIDNISKSQKATSHKHKRGANGRFS